jgi:hypothetical protein
LWYISHPKRKQTLLTLYTLRLRLIIGIKAWLQMGTNKERIEHLESELGVVQEGLLRMEETLNRLSIVLIVNQETPNRGNHQGNDGGWLIVSAKMAKL